MLIIIIMLFFNLSFSYLNKNIIKCVNPSKIRKHLYEQLNCNYTKITYTKAKYILHKEINNIDIYGDNTHGYLVNGSYTGC